MITYEYKCDTCSHEIEILQSIKDKPLKQCPACCQYTLNRVIYGGTLAVVVQEPTTLGQQAERNTKKFGKNKVQELDANTPKYGNPHMENAQKILKRDKEGIERYIMTGK